ncbi:helix-turn-helix domain-containing protein [Cognatilysobacter bugurensis]|uniref:helix-turn-helix domain-containing protein n=1 Tax=Cognatilysobacter bugurensis TaxID=543356 RepID=UPI001671ADF6|nr:helix-turn-helix domain-containing protein [Lysobacter bugurensis]
MNSVLGACDVFGNKWRDVETSLVASTSAKAAVETMFSFIAEVARDPMIAARRDHLARLAEMALARPERVSTERALSTRQFERRFSSAFGISPHRFRMIHRLRLSLADLVAEKAVNVELANQHGFYDQAHLGRDMRRWVGRTPGEIRRLPDDPSDPHWPIRVGARAQRLPSRR